MNILFSCDEYPPVKSGGIGTVTKIVAEELCKRGHNIYVVSGILPNIHLPKQMICNGVEVIRFKYFKHLSFAFGKPNSSGETILLKMLRKIGVMSFLAKKEFYRTHKILQRIIKEKGIDLVEFPDYIKLSDYYKARKVLGFPKYDIPVVARVHGCQSFASFYRDGYITDVDKYNDVSFFNSANKILAVSRFSADFVNKELGIEKTIDVIYNPIDLQALLQEANQVRCARNFEKTIVFVGKVVETKGAFNLIKAFNQFVKSHSEYKLILIGGGDIERGKSLVENSVLDHVIFTGYLSRQDICGYILNASFCVVPSFYENFSMVALEIMALGKAFIYTKEASGAEVINDGVDGLLVDPHNVDDIYEKMTYLAAQPEVCAKLGGAAAERVKEYFALPVIVSELESYYNSLIR